MSGFPSLKFRRTWRPYQERVLGMADLHLGDRRLHIVAAPGSGKTTLGIELFRRLGKAALVLSPTRTIRDQWIDRLREFLPEEAPWPPPWVSSRLDDLRIFTSITYQALHTSARADEETEESIESEATGEGDSLGALDAAEIKDIASRLSAAGVTTLILDEAHHLRAEWWKALTEVSSRVEGMQIVSLTATPPYDSQSREWQRYEELCGTIDEEISVPELVKAATLCAHQDFVWTVIPTEREREYVTQHVEHVEAMAAQLLANESFAQDLLAHPWVAAESPDVDSIQDEPEFAIALLVFVKAKGLALPAGLLGVLDLSADDVPAITTYWWERLLTLYLFGDFPSQDPQFKTRRAQLARDLRDRQLLQQRQLQLLNPRLVSRYMTQSVAKILACADINALEREVRGTSLRQVILTDYIRDEGALDGGEAPHALGAWPVFRHLALSLPADEREVCALLTGRLVIVSKPVLESLRSHCEGAAELSHLPGFCRMIGPRPDIVAALTRALEAGRIRTLVGTRALLGEGWDAPCINSLILASSVGAYVLTNQMRGRAIRIDRSAPEKISSIWHIVAVVLDRRPLVLELLKEQPVFWPGTADIRELMYRFKTFVGLDAANGRIENNLERLGLPYLKRRRDFVTGSDQVEFRAGYLTDPSALLANNDLMADRLRDLGSVQRGWNAAIEAATQGRVVPTVKAEKLPRGLIFSFANTWLNFVIAAVSIFFVAFEIAFSMSKKLLFAAAIGLAFASPKLLRAAWLVIRHLPIDGTLHQIGIAVRNTLCAARIIEESPKRLPVESYSVAGVAYLNLGGGSFRDQSLFADCMREIVSPIANPRYLIVREANWLGFKRRDYHAVPLCLAVKKEYAELFLKAWQRHVGPAKLVYTRSAENRKLLLRARVRAFSAGANDVARAAERTDRWL